MNETNLCLKMSPPFVALSMQFPESATFSGDSATLVGGSSRGKWGFREQLYHCHLGRRCRQAHSHDSWLMTPSLAACTCHPRASSTEPGTGNREPGTSCTPVYAPARSWVSACRISFASLNTGRWLTFMPGNYYDAEEFWLSGGRCFGGHWEWYSPQNDGEFALEFYSCICLMSCV